MYKYVHNNKYQMKYREIARHNEAKRELKYNIYAERSESGNSFLKNNLKFYPNLGVRSEFLVATKFFQVSLIFP